MTGQATLWGFLFFNNYYKWIDLFSHRFLGDSWNDMKLAYSSILASNLWVITLFINNSSGENFLKCCFEISWLIVWTKVLMRKTLIKTKLEFIYLSVQQFLTTYLSYHPPLIRTHVSQLYFNTGWCLTRKALCGKFI